MDKSASFRVAPAISACRSAANSIPLSIQACNGHWLVQAAAQTARQATDKNGAIRANH
jgi:hypothetical protein